MPVNLDLSDVFNGGGPLVSLEAGSSYNISKFPEDIAQTPYFIVFRSVNKFNVGRGIDKLFPSGGGINKILKFATGGGKATIPNHGFALPIPSNLTTSYNARYSDTELGAIGAIGKRAGAAGNAGEIVSNPYAGLKNAIRGASISDADIYGAGGSILMGAVTSGEAGAIAGGLLGGAAKLPALGALTGVGVSQALRGALAGAKIARNPHLATVFQGVDFKTHSFEYKLIAKNKSESDTIRKMIRNFKYAMAPNYLSGFGDHIFQYPNEFDITLAAGSYLFKFGRSVLTDFNVNYTGEGVPAFYEDSGAPYSVSISMTFKETSIVTKKEISQGR